MSELCLRPSSSFARGLQRLLLPHGNKCCLCVIAESREKLPTGNFLVADKQLTAQVEAFGHTIRAMDYRRAREVLREWRLEKRKISVEEVAKRAGLSRPTVYRLENVDRWPDREPDFQTIEKLCNAMDLPLSVFFARVEGSPEVSRGYPAGGLGDIDSGLPPHLKAPRVGTTTDVSAEPDLELAARLISICLLAAEHAGRLNARGVLEEIAVAFALATNSDLAEQTKRTIRERREVS